LKLWQTICDWCWWNFVIKKNEFHKRLDIDYGNLHNTQNYHAELKRVTRERERAHLLDLKWGRK